MEQKEIILEMKMDYRTLIKYLLEKYGSAKYDYFTDATCITRSKYVTRTKDGLFCHHIDEDKGCNLADSAYAKEQPYKYQKAERLVYCNYLEHLLLHIQIGKDNYWRDHKNLFYPKEFTYFIVPGISFICHEINVLFEKNGSPIKWRNRCFYEIKNNFEDYIYILNSFIKYMVEHYTGNRYQKSIYIGQHIKHKYLGDGIISQIEGPEPYNLVIIKFADCEKKIIRNIIDPGDYDKTLIQIKKNLSSTPYQEALPLIYERL